MRRSQRSRRRRAGYLAGCVTLWALGGCSRFDAATPTIDQAPPYSAQQVLAFHAELAAAALWPGSGHRTDDAEAFRFENLNSPRFIPGALIARGGPVAALPYRWRDDIEQAEVDTRDGRMTVDAFVHHFPLDGVLIIHRGAIVYESYPRMRADDTHLIYSVSKTIPALLVARLAEQGAVDPQQPIDRYIPALAASGWRGVLVQNILDMASGIERTGLDDERWEDELWDTLLARPGAAPVSTYDFIAQQRADPAKPQGTDFDYSTKNTFVLAWLVESVTGKPFATVVAEELWQKIGAEQNAHMGVSPLGAPHARFAMTLRDLGRYGLLYTPSWRTVTREPLVSAATLQRMQREGRPYLLKGHEAELNRVAFAGEPVSHNGWQWDAVFADGTLFKSGFAGQGLLISPAHDLVVAFYGSWPAMDRQQYNRFQWLARQLIQRGYFDRP